MTVTELFTNKSDATAFALSMVPYSTMRLISTVPGGYSVTCTIKPLREGE